MILISTFYTLIKTVKAPLGREGSGVWPSSLLCLNPGETSNFRTLVSTIDHSLGPGRAPAATAQRGSWALSELGCSLHLEFFTVLCLRQFILCLGLQLQVSSRMHLLISPSHGCMRKYWNTDQNGTYNTHGPYHFPFLQQLPGLRSGWDLVDSGISQSRRG